jgi:hypothetical protein
MFPLRMTHVAHGATHVYNEQERKDHEARGWKVQTPEELLAVLAAKRGVKPLGENEAMQQPPAEIVSIKRGRPRKA